MLPNKNRFGDLVVSSNKIASIELVSKAPALNSDQMAQQQQQQQQKKSNQNQQGGISLRIIVLITTSIVFLLFAFLYKTTLINNNTTQEEHLTNINNNNNNNNNNNQEIYHYHHHHMINNKLMTTIMKARRIEDLKFANVLTKSLIADPQTANFVRQVPGAMFSYVNPTPLTVEGDEICDDNNDNIGVNAMTAASNSRERVVKWDLVGFSKEVAQECLNLDIPDEVLSDPNHNEHKNLLAYLSGSKTLPSELTKCYAHAYSGHQFGHFAGQLGDGRAVTLGQVQVPSTSSSDDNNSSSRSSSSGSSSTRSNLWELQLKGAGSTPFSRRGDGRAVLRSSVREYLASEAMHHLGIPTTRALSLVKSHEEVVPRDEFYDWNLQLEHAAIVLRLAPCFIRFGSFEHFFYRYKSNMYEEKKQRQEWLLIDKLMDYVIRYHYPELLYSQQSTASGEAEKSDTDTLPRSVRVEFLRQVIQRTAKLFAQWQSVGFTHGVLNTDNMSILGLTIDYGPYGFIDYFDPDFIPNHSDKEGRYSYANQPDIGEWNCDRLIIAVCPAFFEFPLESKSKAAATADNANESGSKDKLPYSVEAFRKFRTEMIKLYWDTYNAEYISIMRSKLGISSQYNQEEVVNLVDGFFDWMTQSKADMTNAFRKLSNISSSFDLEKDKDVFENLCGTMLEKGDANRKLLSEWLTKYVQALRSDQSTDEEQRKKSMDSTNPKYILRNWMAQEAIEKAKKGDYSQVSEIYQLLLRPFDEQSEEMDKKYAQNAPSWARRLRCSCSS